MRSKWGRDSWNWIEAQADGWFDYAKWRKAMGLPKERKPPTEGK